jgi:hypothetical protein
MYQGTKGYSLMKKTEGRKYRDTVSLTSLCPLAFFFYQMTPAVGFARSSTGNGNLDPDRHRYYASTIIPNKGRLGAILLSNFILNIKYNLYKKKMNK